ncbi:HD domain-containing protein [Novosphingobium sp.]|uniref:HD domain-containing protein n=1 Tax=Novosphingobium sp. TaxID=1874826 RepID=UPI0038BD7AF8
MIGLTRTLVALALVAIPASAFAAQPAAPSQVATAPAAPADWREQVRAFAAQHFRNPAWGRSHNERDYLLARELAYTDGARFDDDVLFAAAYLHDLAAFSPWEKPDRDHSDVAAEVVGPILQQAGFPMAKLAAVQGAIREHMYYRDPHAVEATYLHDADALDWLGAVGVARVMALVDPAGGQPDGPAMLKMLQDNLRDVPARIVSPAGKAMMPARRAELESWLGQLAGETRGYAAL